MKVPEESLGYAPEEAFDLRVDLGRLPCDYLDILDELQVLGTKDAVVALRLAHSVAEISLAEGDAHVKLVTSTWTTLRSGRTS